MVSNYLPNSLIAVRKVCGSDRKWPRIEQSNVKARKLPGKKRVKRYEENVSKLVDCFSSRLMSNPFVQEMESLVNFATCVVLT